MPIPERTKIMLRRKKLLNLKKHLQEQIDDIDLMLEETDAVIRLKGPFKNRYQNAEFFRTFNGDLNA